MPRPLSNDLRIRIVKAVDAGASRNTTVKRFGVSISTVVKLMQAVRATGSHEPKRMGGYRPVILEAHRDKVMGLVARRPDATTVKHLQRACASTWRPACAMRAASSNASTEGAYKITHPA